MGGWGDSSIKQTIQNERRGAAVALLTVVEVVIVDALVEGAGAAVLALPGGDVEANLFGCRMRSRSGPVRVESVNQSVGQGQDDNLLCSSVVNQPSTDGSIDGGWNRAPSDSVWRFAAVLRHPPPPIATHTETTDTHTTHNTKSVPRAPCRRTRTTACPGSSAGSPSSARRCRALRCVGCDSGAVVWIP